MTSVETPAKTNTGHRIGTSAPRPDGIPKVTGEFSYSSDLWAEGMLWAHIARSAHPSARIVSIDFADAWIAATALELDIPLVTHNVRDFRFVDGLYTSSK